MYKIESHNTVGNLGSLTRMQDGTGSSALFVLSFKGWYLDSNGVVSIDAVTTAQARGRPDPKLPSGSCMIFENMEICAWHRHATAHARALFLVCSTLAAAAERLAGSAVWAETAPVSRKFTPSYIYPVFLPHTPDRTTLRSGPWRPSGRSLVATRFPRCRLPALPRSLHKLMEQPVLSVKIARWYYSLSCVRRGAREIIAFGLLLARQYSLYKYLATVHNTYRDRTRKLFNARSRCAIS